MKIQFKLLFCILIIGNFRCFSQTIPQRIIAIENQNLTETDGNKLAANNRKIANYLTYLFDLDEALIYAQKAIEQAKKNGNNAEILYSQLTEANIYYNLNRQDTALTIINNSSYLLTKISDKKEKQFATAYFATIKGAMLNANFKIDSALAQFEKALSLLDKNSSDPEEIKLLCNLYTEMAFTIERSEKANENATYILEAVKLAEKYNDKLNLGFVYHKYASLLGSRWGSLESVKYFTKAAENFKELELFGLYGNMLSEIGVEYYYKDSFTLSYKYLKESILFQKNKVPVNNYVETLTVLSKTLTHMDSLEQAETIIREAVSLQDMSKLTYENFITLIQLSEVLNKKGDLEEQWELLKVAGRLADSFKVIDCIIEFQRQKVDYFQAIGNYKEAYFLLEHIKKYDDSIAADYSNQEIDELNVKYETEKKDAEISILNAQQEISNARLSRQRIVIFTVIALSILTAIAGIAIFKRFQLKRKTDLEIERLGRSNEIQKLRSDIALNMHDDIGASLSSIRMYSEAAKTQLKENTSQSERFLQKISENANEVLQNMSDIVWAINPGNDEIKNLRDRMRSYATDLCAANNINFVFMCDEKAQLNIPMDIRRNIYLIFKEAITNAVKYAACKTITITLQIKNSKLLLDVSDDGKGFTEEKIKNEKRHPEGNGLKNMAYRAKEIGGNLSVNSIPQKGTSITLTMEVT